MAGRGNLSVVPEPKPAEERIVEVTEALGQAKKAAESSKKLYERLRGEFFALLTEVAGTDGKAEFEAPDGFTYKRSISYVGAGQVDVQALLDSEPEIATEVLEEVVTYEFNEDMALAYFNAHPEAMVKVQPFVSEGKPQAKLLIAKTKDED